MQRLLVISYWVVSVLVVSLVLTSLGYRFLEAVFVGTMFLPGALTAKYFFPKVDFKERRTAIRNTVYIVLGILIAEVLLFLVAHYYIMNLRAEQQQMNDIPQLLTNPAFIAIILTALATGSHFFEGWLERKHPASPAPITFTSERKPITLSIEEILYVESNDDVTTVVATGGRSFRNITPISRWEAILKPHFIRIHRSYLVNKAAITDIDVDILLIGEIQLPISRKYKDEVLALNPRRPD
ncbi:MAG: LytTR family transcriptional regulator [Bacteroidales bacterium]|nr:LytTR family transcriptional regulator [Bacteroidales bacterium]